MSTTGKRTVGWQNPSLLPTLLTPRNSREEYIAGSAQVWRIISSPAYPLDEEKGRERAADTYDRGVPRSGVLRQMMAVLKQPNRSARLRSLNVPALVIHGLADKMVHVSGGRATAAAITGSELLLIDGMGHDLPPALFETYVAAIRRVADRALSTS
jgi:pimeloyl-ACP methyl ester carboxylesterase